jgi:LysR family nitrogen assimilation transcriptional regulator
MAASVMVWTAMELKQLKYLLALSELGSFSKAAVLLSVAQPVLSRQIRSLEEELGVELLYRTGRGIVVSEAGQIVIEHARSIVNAVGYISTEIDAMRDDPIGRISIGMPPTAGSVLTAPLIQRFHAEYPRIKLKVQEGYSGHVLEWLSTGRIDVAILYNAPKTSTLVTQPLIEEELLLIGPGRHPDTVLKGTIEGAQLAELPLIMPSHPHGLRVLVETLLGTLRIYPNVEYEIDSLTAVVNMVEQGLGYTIPSLCSGRLAGRERPPGRQCNRRAAHDPPSGARHLDAEAGHQCDARAGQDGDAAGARSGQGRRVDAARPAGTLELSRPSQPARLFRPLDNRIMPKRHHSGRGEDVLGSRRFARTHLGRRLFAPGFLPAGG